MNRALLQVWEESNKKEGIRQDGCSLHIDMEHRNLYIKDVYQNRQDEIPISYDRIVGLPTSVIINDSLYNILLESKNIRLMRYELNNLLLTQDIISED